ncbi:MAG: DUF364 domain-containing protein, partial [Geobacteraceae bacterium]|nr:DUF364 domain-containing protein [Geobacteraceae bacterium]
VDALLESVSGTEEKAARVLIGPHWIAVQSRNTGIAHVFRGREGFELSEAGAIQGKDILEIAAGLKSWEPLEASLGLAALSSLVEPTGENANVFDYIMSCAPGKTVTCIGRFPFYERLARSAAQSYLLEMNPQPGELPPFAAEEVIPESDLVIITGTSLINKTLQRLLELSRNSIAIVLGPSTPMNDVLFDFGASVIAGVRIVDQEKLFRSVAQGVKFYNKIEGIEPVTRFRK